MSRCSKRKQQKGGVSDWMHSFYSQGVVGGPAALSRAMLQNIDQAPMFNPLSDNTVLPTGPSTGIIPNGLYLAGMKGGGCGCGQSGGKGRKRGRSLYSMNVADLRRLCHQRGIRCRSANGKLLGKTELLRKLKD